MKIRKFSMVFVAWIPLLVGGCEKDRKSVCPRGIEEDIELVDDEISKSFFSENDRIGIYVVQYAGSTPGVLGDFNFPMNVEYLYSTNGWIAQDDGIILTTGGRADVYGYYPYDPEMSAVPEKSNLRAYPYRVGADQREIPYDFLWAKGYVGSVIENRVALHFKHVLSRLLVNIRYDGIFVENPKLAVHNVQLAALINLETGTATGNGSVKPLTPRETDIPEQGFDRSYEAIVPPQTIPANTPLLIVSTENGHTIFIQETEKNFVANTEYVLNIIVGNADPARSLSGDLIILKTEWHENTL